ncbi:MAG: DUF6754 domain-containing protein [bacterium]
MNKKLGPFFFIVVFLFWMNAFSQIETPIMEIKGELPSPPSDFTATDTPNDDGRSITLTWKKSPDDGAGKMTVLGYTIERSTNAETGFEKIAELKSGETSYIDIEKKENQIVLHKVEKNKDYYYNIYSVGKGGVRSEVVRTGPVQAKVQWFNPQRTNTLIAGILLSLFVLYYIYRARRGIELYIRPISGLEAVQEAIGRATEMGKPVLYILGIMGIDDIQTIAGVTILGKVSRMVAEYDAQILVPCIDPLVATISRDTVKEAYLDGGRPDSFKPDNIRYITSEQFGYVAAVDGIMLRERPAANFYLGTFYAESLILAETGHSIEAIQIAGTAAASQIPFFVAACDYTLIGEELFAASAYLSREPLSLGSIIGQDVGKVIIIISIIIGSILEAFGIGVAKYFITR